MLPEVTARLDADVDPFLRAWDRAADAAERAAARIRAAQNSIRDIDINSGRFNDLNGELERLTRTIRSVSDGVREFGNSTRESGSGLDELGRRAREASGHLGGTGGGGLSGGLGRSAAQSKLMAMGIAAILSVLPAVAAAVLAAGAALQGLGVVAGVVIAGWKGISDAADMLSGRLAALKSQLENVFRQGLTQEFDKLGQALAGLDGPLTNIAQSVVSVVKEFTGWIRSAQGMSEIEQMLGGVDNMVKSLAPGAKALAQAFTAFGAAAAPVMDKIGEAISYVFEELNKVIQKHKEMGTLTKAFEAGASAIEAFGDVLAVAVDFLIEMAAAGGEPAADAIKKFAEALKDCVPFLSLVLAIGAQMINFFMTLVGWVTKLFSVWDPMWRTVTKVNESLTEFMKKIDPKRIDEFGKAIKTFAETLGKDILKAFDDAVKAVKKWADDTKKAIEKGVDDAIKAVKKWVDDNVQAVKKWADEMVKGAKKGADDLVAAVKKGIDDAVRAVQQLPQKAADALQQWGQELEQAARDAWDKLVAAVEAGVTSAIETIKSLPDKARQALETWVSDMEKAGKDAGEGLNKGLESAIANVVQTATQMAQQAMDAIKSTLGISSPSIVMRDEVGAMMAAGMAQGIIQNAALVTTAMQRTGLAAVGAGRSSALGGAAAVGRGTGGQVLRLEVVGGGDSAAGTFIARLAQQGKLKITAKSIVGGAR